MTERVTEATTGGSGLALEARGYDAKWREHLRDSALARHTVVQLGIDAVDVARRVFQAMCHEVPLYRNVPADVEEKILEHSAAHSLALSTLPDLEFDVDALDLSFVSTYAAHRARDGLPLAYLLHAFRLGHRETFAHLSGLAAPIGTVDPERWRTALALSALTMEYTHRICSAAAASYVDSQRTMDALTAHNQRQVLGQLLADPPQPLAVSEARAFGLVVDAPTIVVCAQAGSAGSNAEAMLEAGRRIAAICRPAGWPCLHDIRSADIVGIVQLPDGAEHDLVERLRVPEAGLTTSGVRVGIGGERASLYEARKSYEEARQALAHASDRDPVLLFRDVPVFDHLIATAHPTAYRIKPEWLDVLMAEDSKLDGALLLTLRTYVNKNFSAKATAHALSVHTNTVYYRLRKIEKLSGKRARNAIDVLDLIALSRLHRQSPETSS